MPVYREPEFQRVLQFVREKRVESAQDLALGRFEDFAKARYLCGYIKAMDDIETRMVEITGADEAEGKDL